jgi:hypothetical protein
MTEIIETISKKIGDRIYHVNLQQVDESIIATAKEVAASKPIDMREQSTDLLLDLLQIRKGLLNIMRDTET